MIFPWHARLPVRAAKEGRKGERAITAIIHKYVPRAGNAAHPSPYPLLPRLWQRHHNNRNNNRVVKMSPAHTEEEIEIERLTSHNLTFQKSNLNDICRIASRLDWTDGRRRRRLSDPTGKAIGCSAFSARRRRRCGWRPHLPATFGPPAVIFIDIPQIWRRGGSLTPR